MDQQQRHGVPDDPDNAQDAAGLQRIPSLLQRVENVARQAQLLAQGTVVNAGPIFAAIVLGAVGASLWIAYFRLLAWIDAKRVGRRAAADHAATMAEVDEFHRREREFEQSLKR